ncbi:hypothetical protein GDO78_020375 [Eleutherodactylus coqui]|uniref:Uncharacterized protein n=1 Tax=Eleutherodactylus coqui TaxID=57060 RepID=A0A8J6E7G7_ELECQ|nr:hypothetical protein GDO78_020375 [Eleutherodactylus coqui]
MEARHPRNSNELKHICKEEWFKSPSQCCANLICSDSKYLVEVIAAKRDLQVIKFKRFTYRIFQPIRHAFSLKNHAYLMICLIDQMGSRRQCKVSSW